ncbi:MAG: hypothetical protein BMS9Abin20_0083 [Acidimicrobiia bacterium]|nr:MAG: hypothetical protein BMS9Abin20_0083 [Acidimicrobiia bacterium]
MHLVRRFFGFLSAEPLTPLEQSEVSSILEPPLAKAFFAQRIEDQRHAYSVKLRVGQRNGLYEAALLHDIGKTDSDLGALSRSLATVCNSFGVPTRGRWLDYLNHGEIGAHELEMLGAGDLAVVFTRHHPGAPPLGVEPGSWHLLERADNA